MIKNNIKLTNEQEEFAAANHHIVEDFLKYRHLNENEYYDVIIFGYLRAVINYFNRPELQIYAFSTIANKSMKTDLFNHYRSLKCKKRKATVVSLNSQAYDGSGLTVAEVTAAPDAITDHYAAEIMWNKITADLRADYVEILRMRVDGYNDMEIAKQQNIKVKDIGVIMEQIRETVKGMQLMTAN
jgi:RNA polymerase sigma-70 factor (ECF subfamily)